MKRITKPAEPLNLYSGLFFGIWLLAMVASVGFRQVSDVQLLDGPSYKAQIEEWHQKRVNSLKSDTGAFTTYGYGSLPTKQNKLTAGEKRYGEH